MKNIFRLLLIILIGVAYSCQHRQLFDPEITKDELYDHIDFLASDSLMGRKPGTPFDRVAAKYIKDQLELSGLKMLASNGYQFLEYVDHQEIGSSNSFSVNAKIKEIGKDYSLFPFSSSDTISAAVVFAGYGLSIQSDTLKWDDYSTINPRGKWVMILRGSPFGEKGSNVLERHKAMLARDKGAVGVIFVSGKEYDRNDELITSNQKTFGIGIPVIHVKRSVANKILLSVGQSISEIEQNIIRNRRVHSFLVGANVCARTQIIQRKRKTQNIVGFIEGTDPVLKNQYVIIGAHYDHIGMGGEGSSSRTPDTLAVHNGADDNASGVAAMLEIAQKISTYPTKRSVLVIAFGAEELGLLGSRFFVENPLVPLDSVVAMINIDMLGRMDTDSTLQIGGVGTSLEKEGMLKEVNEEYGLNLALAHQGYGPSDHASFYAKNIPVLFFSTGPHIDYHTPNDDIQGINFNGLLIATNLIHDVVYEIASFPNMLTFQEAGPAAPESRHGDGLKVRFGIMPDVSGVEKEGLLVLAASPNQPAAMAGIEKGDIITAINGKRIGNIHDYMYRLQELSVGSTVSVELLRNEKTIVLLVQL